jgi:hypothetical protein
MVLLPARTQKPIRGFRLAARAELRRPDRRIAIAGQFATGVPGVDVGPLTDAIQVAAAFNPCIGENRRPAAHAPTPRGTSMLHRAWRAETRQ